MGHLIAIGKLVQSQPVGASPLYFPLLFAREHPNILESGVIYIDTWPFGPPMLAAFDADIMAQFTQEKSLPKHKMMKREFRPFTGLNDLVNQEGETWKMWRSIFNPGFSATNLLTFIPHIIEEIEVFKNFLQDVAKSGNVVELEKPTMKCTIDIIGRVVL
jgi:cytochrome P450